MFQVRVLPEFTQWFDSLKDKSIRGVIAARIKRLEHGLMGDVQPVGGGVSELRIHLSPGWRLYFMQTNTVVIVLLIGGSKRTQKKDIARAKVLVAMLDDTEGQGEQAHSDC